MLLNILNKHEGIQEFKSFVFQAPWFWNLRECWVQYPVQVKQPFPFPPSFIGSFQMISTYAGVQLRGHGASALLVLHAGVGILPLLAPADLCGRQEEGEGQCFMFDKCCATV